MTKEEAKEIIEEREKLDIKIMQLEQEQISTDMDIEYLYNKLLFLMVLRSRRLRLDKKIETIERLA